MREEMLAAVKDTEIDIRRFFDSLSEHIKKHSRCVSKLTENLLVRADKEGLLEDEPLPLSFEQIGQAVLYLDVGMSLIPERLLNKKEALTAAERQVIQRHTIYGAKLLDRFRASRNYPPEEAPLWQLAAEVAGNHHERWDGQGYPFGMIATAVPIVSRAVSLADSYDAIVGGTPCRMPLPHEYAILEIASNSKTQFDPDLADIFTRYDSEICLSAGVLST